MFATRRPTVTKRQAPIRRDGYLILETNTIGRHVRISRSPPRSGEVEIAYFTLLEFEGRGFTTEMARHLIQIVKDRQPGTRIFCVYVA